MRAEEFVGRADQDVDPRRRHIDRAVGAKWTASTQASAPASCARSATRRTSVSEPTAFEAHGNATTFVRSGHLRLEIGVVERAVILAEVGVAHDEVEIVGELEPGGDVGVMVEPCDHDLVAGREVAANGSRQREIQRRHVLAETDLRGRGSEKARRRLVRGVDDFVAPPARLERPAEVRVRLA